MANPIVKIIPHSPLEFKNADELRNWLVGELKNSGGVYLVSTIRTRQDLSPGSVCIFMKDQKIVGEAVVKEQVKQYLGTQVSPVTGRRYEGLLTFEPSSIRLYVNPLYVDVARQVTGEKLTAQFAHNLHWDNYKKLLAEIVRSGGFC